MENPTRISIYCDPHMIVWHNPNFGSMENGERVHIDISYYYNKGYTIIYPKPNDIYFDMLKYIHGNNVVFNFLSSDIFKKNILHKILQTEPKSMTNRNCHGCTAQTNSKKCSICGIHKNTDKFFRYVYTIDKNICDADTTYITHTSYAAIKNATSLVCQMVKDVSNKKTKHGFALVRPPGHHASHDKSQGFCLVNNIAVCAHYATTLGLKKVFIFDFDAHHGNGTQEIFYHRKDVFYCSIHTAEAYPKTGAIDETGINDGVGYNLNLVVPKNINTEDYLDIFSSKVKSTIAEYDPDLILVSAGFDGLESDPMTIMNLTPKCYGEMVRTLVKFNVPVCMVLEGGYNVPDLHKCYAICIGELN